MADNKINIRTFCAFQGLPSATESVLKKMYDNTGNFTYAEWYDKLQSTFVLGVKKPFITKKPEEKLVESK